jgi:hypothetical protein
MVIPNSLIPASYYKYPEFFFLFPCFFIKYSPKRHLFITIAYENIKKDSLLL